MNRKNTLPYGVGAYGNTPLPDAITKNGSTAEAVFLITGLTIGAGVLGLPYVIAQVGIIPGIIYLFVLGAIMLLLNMMIAEIVLAVGSNAQLGGLAARYLSRGMAQFFTLTIMVRSCGVLLAYLIGEGVALQGLFGGRADWWTIAFWLVMSGLVAAGLERLKTIEKIISITVISLLVGISLVVFGDFQWSYLSVTTASNWLLPYGVILFALHASPAIIEAHAVIPDNPRRFRQAVLIGTLIPIGVYILFSVAVVGVLGSATTELATIGLGSQFGSMMSVVINVLAILAMSTGFMGLATAFKETLEWDEHLGSTWALLLALGIPLLLFLLGLRGFVSILGVVGGLFISMEALVFVTVYWRVKIAQGVPKARILPLALPIVVVFSFFLVITVIKLL